MPRTNPLSKTERDVGIRLRWVRKSTGLNRTAYCKALGVKWSAYVNYELGGAKVPMRVGWNACHIFGVNQEWLATGKEPRQPARQLHTLLLPEEAFDLPYLEGFERYLRGPIEARIAEERRAMGKATGAPKADDAEISPLGESVMAFPYSVDLLKAMADRLPLHLHWKLFDAVVAGVRGLDDKYSAEIAAHRAAIDAGAGLASAAHWQFKVDYVPPGQKSTVDKLATSQHRPVMPQTLKGLLDAVSAASSGHGKQKAIADSIGVSTSQLSRWINGEGKPNAEATLKLLSWVEGPSEPKTKSSGGVSPPPERMAQAKREQTNEDSKPEPGQPSHKPISKATSRPRKKR